jgi:nicotinate-nucleotide--dimethylbenzimidazole phosphoribosyltransferase
LFTDYDEKAIASTDNEQQTYKALKLEAIEEAPLGLVICYDRSVLNNFTIGTVGAMKQSSLVRSVRHKIFGFPNGKGYSMGWVSI